MLYWMKGVSRTCSFGVTTRRWITVAYTPPPTATSTYRSAAVASGQAR